MVRKRHSIILGSLFTKIFVVIMCGIIFVCWMSLMTVLMGFDYGASFMGSLRRQMMSAGCYQIWYFVRVLSQIMDGYVYMVRSCTDSSAHFLATISSPPLILSSSVSLSYWSTNFYNVWCSQSPPAIQTLYANKFSSYFHSYFSPHLAFMTISVANSIMRICS